MSDLRPEDRITSSKSDGLAEYVLALVERWENKRDVVNRERWQEYRRMWRGEWAPQDRDRASERSKAIMPAIAQAVDSAVSEVEEAVFGRERWFDVDSEDSNSGQNAQEWGRQIADRLLFDLKHIKSAVSECVLLSAIYGTGIGKILINERPDGSIRIDLEPIEPFEFAIDHAADSISEAHGVAHRFHLPRNVVLERQREGIYVDIDPGSAPDSAHNRDDLNRARFLDTDTVLLTEYQGLVPGNMLPDVTDGRKKLPFEDEKLVEAIVTVGNDNVILRATENPLTRRDRGFVAFQWSTVPNLFWGRGVVEQGYWPQKVLDAEIRSRIDALAFSVHPMMAFNAATVPRNADFTVRPGRNIFLNGSPSESFAPVSFPPPDPQTYQQSQEMARYVEMGTGQLQAATPFDTNGRNETASGMSMIMGASIRRTRRTMANIERQFLRPLIRKSLDRLQQFEPTRYPQGAFPFRVYGTLGMMAREFEQLQLSQIMNSLPPGPMQIMILRAIVDNMSLTNREGMIRILDQLLQASMQPQEPPPDLGGIARVMSARLREQEVNNSLQIETEKLLLDRQRLELESRDKSKAHERDVMRISVQADQADSRENVDTTQAILNLVKAETERGSKQIEDLKATLESLNQQPVEGVDLSGIQSLLDQALIRINELENNVQPAGLTSDDISPIRINRNSDGLITDIDGRQVRRNQQGLIEGIV